MKLTKTEILKHQTEIVKILLKQKALDAEKKPHVAALEEDFAAHEADYRRGIKTPAGWLVRKPRWNFDARQDDERS